MVSSMKRTPAESFTVRDFSVLWVCSRSSSRELPLRDDESEYDSFAWLL